MLYQLDQGGLLPRFLRWVLSGADAILTLADASRDELLNIGVPAERVHGFRYWVDQQAFAPGDRQAARVACGWADQTFTALFVGRLIPAKGVRLVLAAARALPDLRIVIAGDGPLHAEVEAVSTNNRTLSVPAEGTVAAAFLYSSNIM
jgi:glycosyltransferase involved in cell wall biosynthesis